MPARPARLNLPHQIPRALGTLTSGRYPVGYNNKFQWACDRGDGYPHLIEEWCVSVEAVSLRDLIAAPGWAISHSNYLF